MRAYLIAALLLAMPSASVAQSMYCYPLRSDSLHSVYLENIRNYASEPDSSWAAAGTALGFPRVPASGVVLITNEAVCQAAAQAFRANVPAGGSSPPSGRVYVFAVGASHFYVVDPEYRVSPTMSYELLLTTNWTLVKRLGH